MTDPSRDARALLAAELESDDFTSTAANVSAGANGPVVRHAISAMSKLIEARDHYAGLYADRCGDLLRALAQVEAVKEACAAFHEAEAAKHDALQSAADMRRPNWTKRSDPKGWAPGSMWITHGGIASLHRESAAAIRALDVVGVVS